jgi:hypothetical protein
MITNDGRKNAHILKKYINLYQDNGKVKGGDSLQKAIQVNIVFNEINNRYRSCSFSSDKALSSQ